MSWSSQSKHCSLKELEAFKRELEVARRTVKTEEGIVEVAAFEEKWVGNCIGCGRVIPSTKRFCPYCK